MLPCTSRSLSSCEGSHSVCRSAKTRIKISLQGSKVLHLWHEAELTGFFHVHKVNCLCYCVASYPGSPLAEYKAITAHACASVLVYLSFQEATNELVPLDLFGNYFFIFKTVMYDAVIVYMIKIYDRGKCSLLA